MISALTSEELCGFVRRLLDSRPSLAVFGDKVEAASYDVLLKRYGAAAKDGEQSQQPLSEGLLLCLCYSSHDSSLMLPSGSSSPASRGGVQTEPSVSGRLKQALGFGSWGKSS